MKSVGIKIIDVYGKDKIEIKKYNTWLYTVYTAPYSNIYEFLDIEIPWVGFQ